MRPGSTNRGVARRRGAANKKCVIKQVTTVGNWDQILLGTVGASVEHGPHITPQSLGRALSMTRVFSHFQGLAVGAGEPAWKWWCRGHLQILARRLLSPYSALPPTCSLLRELLPSSSAVHTALWTPSHLLHFLLGPFPSPFQQLSI